MEYLISIIVPVYKVEKFLPECVESILAQTYKNFELFLVDDGSPDKCGEICDEYAKKDKRITVIHKENGGLSDARNAAMDKVHGEYLTFIDSDDFIHEDYLKRMVYCVKKFDADIVQCDFTRDRESLGCQNQTNKFIKLNNDEILREYLHFKAPKVFAWGKLYKTSLFNGIRFPFGLIDEDNFTTYKLFYLSKTFVKINHGLYYYRVNQNSIMHMSFSKRKFGILDSTQEIRDYLCKKTNAFDYDIDYYDIREMVQIYNNAISADADEEFAPELNKIRSSLKKYFRIKMEMKYKIMIFALLFFPKSYKKFIKKNRKQLI